jgi:hypothetical protein
VTTSSLILDESLAPVVHLLEAHRDFVGCRKRYGRTICTSLDSTAPLVMRRMSEGLSALPAVFLIAMGRSASRQMIPAELQGDLAFHLPSHNHGRMIAAHS